LGCSLIYPQAIIPVFRWEFLEMPPFRQVFCQNLSGN
jgi:hypothetical protein